MGMSLGGGKTKAEINMTPMIDVLLVLIIIFMVITPTVSVGLDTQVPQPSVAADAEPARPTEIVVSILADGSIRLNQEPVERANLEGRLTALFARSGDTPVFIRGDKSLEYRSVAEVIDTAKRAGVHRIALMGN